MDHLAPLRRNTFMDQQEVIQFIRDNAESIQGDKNRITILRESSGEKRDYICRAKLNET